MSPTPDTLPIRRRDLLLTLGALALSGCRGGPLLAPAVAAESDGAAVTLDAVRRARAAAGAVARPTPLLRSIALGERCGAPVYLKLENLQRTGSFKVRGAYNRMIRLAAGERARGVLAASAGNHAQGVALAARQLGIPATILMPETVAATKLAATRALGARVILRGAAFDAALARALELQRETGATFVHPYDDPDVIAGQGAIGLDILEALPEVGSVLVPVGGGGLAAGLAVALKTLKPAVRLIGVEPLHAPSLAAARRAGTPTRVQVQPTLAEGTAVARTGDLPWSILNARLDDLLLIPEPAIADAIRWLLFKEKVLAEGAGALAVAALQSGQYAPRAPTVALVSGGNLDPARLRALLADGLEQINGA